MLTDARHKAETALRPLKAADDLETIDQGALIHTCTGLVFWILLCIGSQFLGWILWTGLTLVSTESAN